MRRSLIAGLALATQSLALENGLARKPPMGWLSWQRFLCDVNQDLILETAKQFVNHGLVRLGYVYINIDDCWSTRERDPETGALTPDPEKFKDGIPFLVKELQNRGLKLGMYADLGTLTCQGFPGLLQVDNSGHTYLERDLRQFVDWGVSALKVDGCNPSPPRPNSAQWSAQYSKLSRVLTELTKVDDTQKILLSCSWPAYQRDNCENERDMETLKNICNLWRNFWDIDDSWKRVKEIAQFWAREDPNDIMVRAAGPGHWNDPDMLLIGNPGLSISEQRAQFALWAILAAPLYISTDLSKISADSLAILKNEKVIAVNQDDLGKQGYVLYDEKKGNRRIWVRELSSDESGMPRLAVLFENKATAFKEVEFVLKFEHLGWAHSEGVYVLIDNVHTPMEAEVARQPITEPFKVKVDESSVEMFVFTVDKAHYPRTVVSKDEAPHTGMGQIKKHFTAAMSYLSWN
jgi:alpha-N-acetylgalactosaminidase